MTPSPTSLHRRSTQRTLRPVDSRRNNLALVLQTLLDNPNTTRADLARSTGLTRVTISDLVAELIADGLIAETGQTTETRPGKPATMLMVRDDTRDIVALDISTPDSISGGVFSVTGDRRDMVSADLRSATGEEAVDAVVALTATLVERCHNPILGIGVGTPGIVSTDGLVLQAPNLGWRDFPLKQRLADAFAVPVVVENDANAAVMAERSYAAQPADLLRVQISRGVGAGLLLAGTLVAGSSYAAGEIGHVVVEQDGEPCPCGKRGCLETWASTPNLRRRVAADPSRRDETLSEAGCRLGIALAPIVSMLDLADIILDGPSDLVNGPFRAAAEEVIHARTHSDFRADVALCPSSLGQDAVVMGAAALVRRATIGIS